MDNSVASIDSKTKGQVGDVNIFKSEDDGVYIGEINVMIADQKARRKGIATEAIFIMMFYCWKHFGIDKYVAKILEDNKPSIELFKKLGFKQIGYQKVFKEYVFEFEVTADKKNQQFLLEKTKHIVFAKYE